MVDTAAETYSGGPNGCQTIVTKNVKKEKKEITPSGSQGIVAIA